MTVETIWALIDTTDYCVGEFVGCCRPSAADTATSFDVAVLVDRRGDMMVEDLIVDRAAGTGRWVTHAESRQRRDLLDRLNAMDRAQYLEFVLAEVRAMLPITEGR